MKPKLFSASITGTVIVAVCCFTPILVVLFAVLGVSAWLGWADMVLLPLLAICIALTVYAWFAGKHGSTS